MIFSLDESFSLDTETNSRGEAISSIVYQILPHVYLYSRDIPTISLQQSKNARFALILNQNRKKKEEKERLIWYKRFKSLHTTLISALNP